MLFAAIIIVLVAAIAYFHYTQGFLSSLISAICAVFAAVVAVGLHESVEQSLSRGRFADEASAAILVVLFAAVYLLLRLIFDTLVSGNVRVAVWLEKGGAAVLGLVVGIFATGIVAIAAQAMPFGPTILFYSRFPVASNSEVVVAVPGSRNVDSSTTNVLVSDTLSPEHRTGLILPVDDLVLQTVAHLSDGGSLAGQRPLRSIHPNYLDELFGQRIGIQTGAKHTAVNKPENQEVKVIGAYWVQQPLKQMDGEYENIRDLKFEPVLSPRPDQVAIAVRIVFNPNAADSDHIVRFSCGSVHLVANGHLYFPVGTIAGGRTVVRNKPDDFLFINVKEMNAGADMLFIVNKSDLETGGQELKVGEKLPPGIFISVKRLANVQLSGLELQPGAVLKDTTGAGWEIRVMRRKGIHIPGERNPVTAKPRR